MLKGPQRRKEILKWLQESDTPVSGTALAERFAVSRQVIVQDIALLRAADHEILSTNRGYLLNRPSQVTRVIKVLHNEAEIADELNTIVDCGGAVLNVFVRHKVYGRLQAELNIRSRLDVRRFMTDLASGKSNPLMKVTSGYHYHTIAADSAQTLDLIETELKARHYLVRT